MHEGNSGVRTRGRREDEYARQGVAATSKADLLLAERRGSPVGSGDCRILGQRIPCLAFPEHPYEWHEQHDQHGSQ
jgi:hypothetical protein